MGTAADLQTQWARLVIDSFVQAGVGDAIISPGSRSTPFVIAALEHEGLECASALDERSGAHYALGQAHCPMCTKGARGEACSSPDPARSRPRIAHQARSHTRVPRVRGRRSRTVWNATLD